MEPRALTDKALESIYGVDLNPFAVSIAQFRLLVAWLETRGRARNGSFWGGSSPTPLRLVRRFTAHEVAHG